MENNNLVNMAKCTNYNFCKTALRGDVINIANLKDKNCPECGKTLKLLDNNSINYQKIIFILKILVLVLLVILFIILIYKNINKDFNKEQTKKEILKAYFGEDWEKANINLKIYYDLKKDIINKDKAIEMYKVNNSNLKKDIIKKDNIINKLKEEKNILMQTITNNIDKNTTNKNIIVEMEEQEDNNSLLTLIYENKPQNYIDIELTENDYLKAIKEPLLDLSIYSIYDLYYLRNAILAYNGLDFSLVNASLHKRFSKYKWYKPSIKNETKVFNRLKYTQRENIRKLLEEEQNRLAGLILPDFYKIYVAKLSSKNLNKYTNEQLKVLKNSLLARYGYKFKEKRLLYFFEQFKWYKINDDITQDIIIEQKLNNIQKHNFDTISNLLGEKR